VLLGWTLLSLGAAALFPRIEIDTDFLSFFGPRSSVRRDFEAVNRLLSGAIPLYVTLTGEGPGTFREPRVLAALEDLQARIAPLPGVSHAASFVDTLRRLNRAFEADDPAAERIPATRSGVAELLFLVPKGELGRFLNVDQSRANLVVRTGRVGSSAIRDLVTRIEESVAARPLPGVVAAHVTGNTLLLARSADGIAAAQSRSVGVATLVIFALVAGSLRSLPLGLLAMLPNLVPVLLFFGLLGAGLAPLSLPTSLIGSIVLGISIDDTVHYLMRYQREREAGCTPEEATLRARVRVGRPVTLATAMLCLGFAVVALSGFATLRQFGLLSSATMLICLAADLVLLPALLVSGPRAGAARRSPPPAPGSDPASRR
jgi:predicted RND superfamily exporter protein